MAKIELIGGHIGFMLIIEMVKIELTAAILDLLYLYRLPELNSNYANYRDGQNRINRRPYWIYAY